MVFPSYPPARRSVAALAALLGTLGVGLLAITAESLWIDEFASLAVADHESFALFFGALTTSQESDGQMPLFMLWLWSWIQLFGDSEWTLRAANLPWFLVGVFGLAHWNRLARFSGQSTIILLACLSPFLWFYLNEARPYVMQFAGASLFLGGTATVVAVSHRRTHIVFGAADCWLASIGALLLCGSSLLGVPWLLSGLVVLAIGRREGVVHKFRRCHAPVIVAGVLLSVLAGYYVETLFRGARPFEQESGLLLGFAFSSYELLGFIGLGPSRLDLRTFGPAASTPYIPILITAAVVWATTIGIGTQRTLRRSKPSGGTIILVLTLVVPPMVFLGLLSEWRSFRLLGRHLTPLLPIVLLLFARSMSALRASRMTLDTLVLAAALLLWAVSAVSWRTNDRHRKDNYRSAAEFAVEALNNGGTVWWAANRLGAVYYSLPLDQLDTIGAGIGRSSSAHSLFSLENPAPADLEALTPPDILVLSKPDLFDSHVALRAVVLDGSYRLSRATAAFSIYARTDRD